MSEYFTEQAAQRKQHGLKVNTKRLFFGRILNMAYVLL
ncbi:hypothetical protein SAMN05518865_10115 [Duganella sp. CF458]|nr:hypothetical protein SAMN05518865_10115 [Duganella sp. CF458]